MNGQRMIVLGIAVAILATCSTVDAAMIGFQFVSDRDASAALNNSAVAGAPGYQQANWNSSTPGVITGNNGQAALSDSDGEATTADVAWVSNGTWTTANGTANPDAELMNGYIDNIGATGQSTITVTNIPYKYFTAVAYFGSDGNGRTGQVTNGTTTYSYSTFSNNPSGGAPADFTSADYLLTTDTAAGNPDANYAVFTGLSGGSVTLDILRGSNNSGFHAVQIVEAIPEPATMSLIGMALIGLGFLRRRS